MTHAHEVWWPIPGKGKGKNGGLLERRKCDMILLWGGGKCGWLVGR